MQRTILSEYLTQLTRFPGVFPVNCYLVRESDGFTLIDTGLAGTANALLAAAQELGAPIRRIALTHAHGDHAGSLDALHAAAPDAEVIVSAREARIMGGDRSLDVGEAQGPIRGSYQKVATRPTRLVQPGERIGSLEVVAAQGHTPGQVAFRDTRDGALIAGDALSTFRGVAVAGVLRPLFPFPALATWDLATALATARRLRALDPSLVAIGHGDALRGSLAPLDAAIATAARRLNARGERHDATTA